MPLVLAPMTLATNVGPLRARRRQALAVGEDLRCPRGQLGPVLAEEAADHDRDHELRAEAGQAPIGWEDVLRGRRR